MVISLKLVVAVANRNSSVDVSILINDVDKLSFVVCDGGISVVLLVSVCLVI